MKKYRIAIEETLRKVVEIEAETPGLAVCRAEDEYNEEKHVLSADNFAGADIALSTDDITVMETLEDVAQIRNFGFEPLSELLGASCKKV